MGAGADNQGSGELSFGRFVLQPGRQLLEDGHPVALGGRALDLLSALAASNGDLVTKDELMAAVWPGVIVEENAIQVHISAARKALAEEAGRLVTVRGRGYRLSVEAPLNTAPPSSLAVLAFANMTGDPAKEYLSSGIAEELITTLSRFSDLKIPARTSAFVYKNGDVDIRTIARELGVAMVLEGSVRMSADRIRVTTQLIEAESGFHIWAQNFDRSMDDLFALQDDLAQAIARVLQTKLRGASRSDNPDAYSLYLQARGLAGQVSPQSIQRAVELHREAIALDPGFARAWEGLGGTLMVGVATNLLPDECRAEARAAVDEAIRLDPGAAAPFAIRAVLEAEARNWLGAADDFQTAIELDPVEPVALSSLAISLWAAVGQSQKALKLARRAVELAPASANLRLAYSFLSAIVGDIDEARAQLDLAALLGVNQTRSMFYIVQAELAACDGRPLDAARAYAAALGDTLACDQHKLHDCAETVMLALAGQGDRDAAVVEILELAVPAGGEQERRRASAAPGHIIRWLTLLGAVPEAFGVIEVLLKAGRSFKGSATAGLSHIWRHDMASFRSHARFPELAAALRLLPFWARHGAPDGYRLSDGILIPSGSEAGKRPRVAPAPAPHGPV